jgi:hypothetical protein
MKPPTKRQLDAAVERWIDADTHLRYLLEAKRKQQSCTKQFCACDPKPDGENRVIMISENEELDQRIECFCLKCGGGIL